MENFKDIFDTPCDLRRMCYYFYFGSSSKSHEVPTCNCACSIWFYTYDVVEVAIAHSQNHCTLDR